MTGLAFPKQVLIRDRAHLNRIIALGCCVPGCVAHFSRFSDPWVREQFAGRIHPHHVRLGAGAGMKQKPGDERCVPLDWLHHDEVHKGARTFERKYGIDLYTISQILWAETLDIRSKQQ